MTCSKSSYDKHPDCVNHLHRHDKKSGLEETRIPWFKLSEKKFTGNELRLSYTGLCAALLCTSRGLKRYLILVEDCSNQAIIWLKSYCKLRKNY